MGLSSLTEATGPPSSPPTGTPPPSTAYHPPPATPRLAPLDVRPEDVDLDDVIDRPARGLHQVLDLSEDGLGLAVHAVPSDHIAAVFGDHAGDEDLVADDEAVGPRLRRGIRHLRARDLLFH